MQELTKKKNLGVSTCSNKEKKHDVLNTIQVIVVTIGSSKEKMTKMMSTLVVQVLELTTPKKKLGCLLSWSYELRKLKNHDDERDICHQGFKACNTKKPKMTSCVHCPGLIG